VTKYVAQRLIERERALAETAAPLNGDARRELQSQRRRRQWHALRTFVLGVFAALVALVALALMFPGGR
jgi:hypothetical protein